MNCHEHLKIGVNRVVYWFKDMPNLCRWLQNLSASDFNEIRITHPEKTPRPEERIMLELFPEKNDFRQAGY